MGNMAGMADRQDPDRSLELEELEEDADFRARKTLRRLKRLRGFSDIEIAERLGVPRSTVQSYFGGSRRLTAGMGAVIASVLDVDPYVLFMDPDDAENWVRLNRPNPDPGGTQQRPHRSRKPRSTQRTTQASTMWETPVRGELVGAAAA